MTRQKKYPDTPVFHFYNANPHNRFTTDCVIRAISTATKIPYNTVLMEMADLQCKTGFDISDKTLIEKYLKGKGWVKHKQPRKNDNTKYTGVEFCAELQNFNMDFPESMGARYIANLGGGHIVAIVNGQVWDTWDSTDGCIGNYWTK